MVFDGKYKLITGFDPENVRNRGIFIKFKKHPLAQPVLLFDLEKDPYQLRDVVEERPEVVKELAAELNGWLEKTGDPWAKKPVEAPAAG